MIQNIENKNIQPKFITELFHKVPEKNKNQKDSFEFSSSNKLFDKVDNILNLGENRKLDLSDLNSEEKEQFFKILEKLFQNGIIGYEVLEVNGRPEKHFIENQIGDERLYGKKLYKRKI